MADLVRRATVKVVYKGNNISDYIMTDLESFTYVDQAGSTADTLNVTLADPEYKWRDKWVGDIGDQVEAWIKTSDWFAPKEKRELECGHFAVDKPNCSGPPPKFSLSCSSIDVSKSANRQKNSRTWEAVRLQAVAKKLAAGHGMDLFWEAPDNPVLDRLTQARESDLAFLRRVCRRHGLNLKVDGAKLIVYHLADRMAQAPAAVVRAEACSNYSFSIQGFKSASKCTAVHRDPKQNRLFIKEYQTGSDPDVGRKEVIDLRAIGDSEAEALAKARLERINEDYFIGSVTCFGDTALRAGLTCELNGFGAYDRPVFITTASHNVTASGQYTTTINVSTKKVIKVRA